MTLQDYLRKRFPEYYAKIDNGKAVTKAQSREIAQACADWAEENTEG